MALKRLPNNVQSMLCATSHVNNFKTAVEELVYNSLDAESTSIAIRIHIKESTIQVIDNGSGVTKHDFNVLGQRYMTSKFVDISTLKAAPKNYGYRGEFLANIITVSQMVKITSRHESTEETWAKTFHNGKEKKFAKMTTRPTKGTTVDIKGFLYNQNIQKRSIDLVNELQDIKQILNQLSLARSNISFSLRDDSKNEIIFKIHKKRDIYQTLSTLFNIDQADVVELQVEKHEYKVKGFIGKTNKDLNLHWVYLNGKYINSCKLHKVLNDYFKKSLNIKEQRLMKSKKNNDEEQLFKRSFPFYFIFITCPYIDYDINFTPKQSVIEFKNWEKIDKLLEKLVKFYVGDVNLKEINKPETKGINKELTSSKCNPDTRDQVKKIMDKILGSNSKKIRVSQLQNGVKGKLIKRKKKKPLKKSADTLTLFNNNEKIQNISPKRKLVAIIEDNGENQIETISKSNIEHKISSIHNKKVDSPNIKELKIKELKKKERKFKILSPTRKPLNKQIKNKINKTKIQKVKSNKNKMLNIIKGTDSVCKKSKIVAQKAENFLQQHVKKRNHKLTQLKCYANRESKDNVFLQQKCDVINDNNIFLPPKINKSILNRYIINKLKPKSYKTTYDLVQTILKSQQVINTEKYNMSQKSFSEFSDLDNLRRNGFPHYMPRITRRYTCTNKYILNSYSNTDCKQITQYDASIPKPYKIYEYEDNATEYSINYGQNKSPELMRTISDPDGSIYCSDIYREIIKCKQNETSYHTFVDPNRLLTYDSHQYDNDQRNKVVFNKDYGHIFNTKNNTRFITKESRENFITSNDIRNKLKKRPSNMTFGKHTNIYDIRMKQTIDESYSIQYSKTNENNVFKFAQEDLFVNSVNYIQHNDTVKNNTNDMNQTYKVPVNELNSVFGNTYSIQTSDLSVGNIKPQNQTKNQCIESYEPFNTYSINYSNSEINENMIRSKSITKDNTRDEDYNIVLMSRQQTSDKEPPLNNNIEPLNVCETVYDELGTIEKEFAFSFNGNKPSNDSLYDNYLNNECVESRLEKEPSKHGDDITENVSHHFSNAVVANTKQNVTVNYFNVQDLSPIQRDQNDNANIVTKVGDLPNIDVESNFNINQADIEIKKINFKNRPRFMPKGMSQIFVNCRSKTSCDYNIVADYYEDGIYDNFANDVQANSEIYEPIIQNIEDLTTKNIHKFQNKVKKDNASLVFNEKSLREAKVLGQVDCKFIAAIMKKCSEMEEATEYLILFDQHAVHERIQLEKNLGDYINEDRWTSVPIHHIILKMSKDEILYLHNYRDKFTQLGLNWTISSDNELIVHSIPEAILGKNPREVEKIIKAVKNLIIEEIKIIKLQKGCMSIYPKSIMELVFSEACRYAIKFGDHLNKNDCDELIKALSGCKTPFQCAHGRPVMAVLMENKHVQRDYKINMGQLSRFKARNAKKP